MNQRDFATSIGVSQSAVAQWERGTTQPTAGNLQKIAQVLNCAIDEFL
jgi:transcriptional regulator with XRE-family HTH domain